MKINELTVVIVTNRTGARFESALESAKFAQQIVIVDNTVGTMREQTNWKHFEKNYPIIVLPHQEKIINFSEVRNKALKNVQTPWVLFLDSDETLSKDAGGEILKIIEQDLFDAISSKRTDYFLGRPLNYGETGNLLLTRLFKTKKSTFIRNVHEVVEYEGKLGTANFVISHFSHNSIQEFLIKITTYSYFESKNKTTSITENTIQMYIFPIAKFILNYFIKLGFLDGYRGLVYALMMSLHSFFVRVFYYEKL